VQDLFFGEVQIGDFHIQVDLLRVDVPGPLRGNVRADSLEGQSRPIRGVADRYPVRFIIDPDHA